MKIYTKKGDTGNTSLIGGKIVQKHDLKVDAYGNIDELNSFLGLVRDLSNDKKVNNIIVTIQKKLFSIGSILALGDYKSDTKIDNKKLQIKKIDIDYIENEIDKIDKNLSPITKFTIPGGNKLISYLHISRCVCRRAERKISYVNEIEKLDPNIPAYINRLSDLLFILSRYFCKKLNVKELYW
jgi:cob(I)alamin adenosyltransferase